MTNSKKILLLLIAIFLITTFYLGYYKFYESSRKYLTVAFLDVGQGDSIFIEAPNGNQILIDAGQTSAVVRQVSKMLPFYDRQLNLVIATHQDSDHIGGFPEIFKKYKIEKYATGSRRDENILFEEIENLIEKEKSDKFILFAGDRIILDKEKNIYLDILWPPEGENFSDTNEASVVANLVYDQISFILTGDASKEIEEKILASHFFHIKNFDNNKSENGVENLSATINNNKLKNYSQNTPPLNLSDIIKEITILKLGHHGSKTSTSENFLEKIKPEYAIISAGKDNKFGHPHQEVVETLKKYSQNQNRELKIIETAVHGTAVFNTDGQNVWITK